MRNPIDQMFGTYINLEEPHQGPLHGWSPELAYRRLASDVRGRYPGLQRVLPEGFRQELAQLAIEDQVAVKDPRDRAREHSSERWLALCDLVAHYGKLSVGRRADLHALLISLGFVSVVAELASKHPLSLRTGEEDDCRYLYSVATARYVDHFETGNSYEITEFEVLANEAPKASVVRFNSLLHMVVQNARDVRDAGTVRYWSDRCEREAEQVLSQVSEFDKHLLLSRMYRGTSFAPFLEGDRQQTVDVMDKAQWHAERVEAHCENPEQEVVYKENWIPLLQSRSKEAAWIGDLELAEQRLRKATRIDPLDSLRWCELGDIRIRRRDVAGASQAFLNAAALCPPGSAYCWFMVGNCYEQSDRHAEAMEAYIRALEIDPLCVSAFEATHALAQRLGRRDVACWASASLETLAKAA
jgi:tetratricopeptide (TPR) repeat protein